MKSARQPSSVEADFRAACGPIEPPPHDGSLSEALSVRHPSVLRWMTSAPILISENSIRGTTAGPNATGHAASAGDWARPPMRPVDWYAGASVNLDPDFRPSKSLSYAAGEFYLQDAGSLLPLALLRLDTDEPLVSGRQVLDLCAAPGGKATAVARGIGTGFLLANEPIAARVGLLRMMLARTGQVRYATSAMDPKTLSQDCSGMFDVVLVDAPCSGQSMVGRGKQKRSAFDPQAIAFNAARQRRILVAADRMLRPGGCLLYSTCTFAYAENESQVQWLVQEHGYAVDPESRLAAYETTEGCYRLWPMRDHCDGHFACRLRKPDVASSEIDEPPMRSKRRPRRAGKERLSLSEAAAWLRQHIELSNPAISAHGSVLTTLPNDAPTWTGLAGIQGPAIAVHHHQSFRPHETSAWRSDVVAATDRRFVSLDDAMAMRFVAGEPVEVSADGSHELDEAESRWCVAKWQDRPLGWAKLDGDRLKNHYPKSLRQDLHHPR